MPEQNENMEKDENLSSIKSGGYVSEDPVILDAFSDMKNAILAKRTDIVRQILSAAQSCKLVKWFITYIVYVHVLYFPVSSGLYETSNTLS